MIEVLEFIFGSWVHFIGVVFLMLIVSKWNFVKVTLNAGDSGLLNKLAEIGKQKKDEDILLKS